MRTSRSPAAVPAPVVAVKDAPVPVAGATSSRTAGGDTGQPAQARGPTVEVAAYPLSTFTSVLPDQVIELHELDTGPQRAELATILLLMNVLRCRASS